MNGARLSSGRDSWTGEWPRRWRRRHRRQAREAAAGRAPYNLWVNAPLTPATRSSDLPVGLTLDEAIRIADAITAAHAESTRTIYAWAWSHWERWCAARGAIALPAEPAMICAYLTERAADGLSVGTIDMACGAIAYTHRRHGLDDPILAEGVRQVRRGLRRIIGTAPRRQARPLATEEIRQIVEHIDRTTAHGARDAAIILLGYASAMRRSELAALTLADVEFKPGGVMLTICRSKTDQHAEGQVVAVVHGQHAATDPVAALDTWLRFRGRDAGWLFTSMRNKTVTNEAIFGEAISIVLRKRAKAAGLAAERITAHSPRAGHATSAAVAGVAVDCIAPRPDTSGSPPSSSATSDRPKRRSTPPAAISACSPQPPSPPMRHIAAGRHTQVATLRALVGADSGRTARSDQRRAELEQLLLDEVEGSHTVFRASEDECSFGRGE
jgi:integrase